MDYKGKGNRMIPKIQKGSSTRSELQNRKLLPSKIWKDELGRTRGMTYKQLLNHHGIRIERETYT